MLFGTVLGDPAVKGDEEDEGVELGESGTRMVEHGECVSIDSSLQFGGSQPYKPFYTADEVRTFRTFGLETGMIPTPITAESLISLKGFSSLDSRITQSYCLKIILNTPSSYIQMRM